MIVEKKLINLQAPFKTAAGFIFNKPVVAYEEYGDKNHPVIFVTHGGLSNQHAAGKYKEDDPLPGWWDGLIGSRKVFDTDKYRIIAANSLGSMYGTTSPLTINPATGCRYGATFPTINFCDMVRFYKLFLDELGVKKLFLMAGPSMGSMQSLQMAALYPDYVGAVISVATAGRMTPSGILMHHFIINALKMDPAFQGGWYELEKPLLALKIIMQVMKIYYIDQKFAKQTFWDTVPESQQVQDIRSNALASYLTATLDMEIKDRDPNCMITVLNAINTFDLGRDANNYKEGVQRIQCPALLMNIDTDQEFPPNWAQEVVDTLNEKEPNQAKFKLLTSPWGHLGCVKEIEQMSRHIKKFMAGLKIL